MRSLASLRPEFPKPLIQIITRTIDRDPARRPADAAEVQAALSAVALAPDTEPVRRTPVEWWIGGAVTALTLAVILQARC